MQHHGEDSCETQNDKVARKSDKKTSNDSILYKSLQTAAIPINMHEHWPKTSLNQTESSPPPYPHSHIQAYTSI